MKTKSLLSLLSIPITITILSTIILTSTTTHADNGSVVDEINITVPISCTMSGTGTDSHNATINNGQYNSSIGESTIKAFCNDDEGFAIYAVGFTDDEPGKNVLSNSTLENAYDIPTGTLTTGATSQWAMKLAATNSTYTPVIAGSNVDTLKEQGDPDFTSFQQVPSRYTKVAYKTSGTDIGTNAEGSILTSTYQAYISSTQPAGTYTGQVKYTLIHPNDTTAPITHPAVLDAGQTVNSKLKSLAATVVNGEETIVSPTFDSNEDWGSGDDNYIKSISVHLGTPAPVGFVPTEANTISSATSNRPIYIVFDNTNDAGIMHFYTEGEQIILPSDSSFMFYMLYGLTEISGISEWNTSNAANMSSMFLSAGSSVTTFTLDLSSWNTSNVTNMNSMFSNAGYSATSWSVGNLSSWDTSNVADMSNMFSNAGYSATTFSLDLSSWNTSNVANMNSMFYNTGYSATNWSIGDLSSWNTSSVTSMGYMFRGAGHSTTNWSIGDLSSWNTSSVTSLAGMFQYAGFSASTFILNLSSWNTSNVSSMNNIFDQAGYYASTFILDLSSWNVSRVNSLYRVFCNAGFSASTFILNLSSWNTYGTTSMGDMFRGAGYSATNWSVTIPQTNGNNISNTTSRLYGQTSSTYGTPPTGKSFTLAQP